MIIKILSSAKNFAGINYNERKNDTGESELLCAKNFDGLSFQTDLVRADYINYMKTIGSLNPRVKNKQFHAVISVKGKSMSVDKLVDVGVQYLDKMGYGSNPYLIYHHGDTDNTHIHLVTTRVDKNGRKVDDSYEKLRSQKVMHEILSRDPLYEADTSITNALKYNFSTEAQFKWLLELQGFKVRESRGNSIGKPEGWEIIKYGEVLRVLDPNSVDKRIDSYTFPKQRVAQLKALFLKYSVGLSEDQ
ncbi:MAG: relaxase/mobilization nuclease domain-containing protein, partial [Cyclobacteriaceae bacterium]|nr:relaxase/mobilization nuclease domain-containing protein [Cyclobacteriaceae bacterium]